LISYSTRAQISRRSSRTAIMPVVSFASEPSSHANNQARGQGSSVAQIAGPISVPAHLGVPSSTSTQSMDPLDDPFWRIRAPKAALWLLVSKYTVHTCTSKQSPSKHPRTDVELRLVNAMVRLLCLDKGVHDVREGVVLSNRALLNIPKSIKTQDLKAPRPLSHRAHPCPGKVFAPLR
jgi:hypothetical protein